MYPGLHFLKKAVFRGGVFLLLPSFQGWLDRVLFSSSGRNSRRTSFKQWPFYTYTVHHVYKEALNNHLKFLFSHLKHMLNPVIGMKQKRSKACWREVHPLCDKYSLGILSIFTVSDGHMSQLLLSRIILIL